MNVVSLVIILLTISLVSVCECSVLAMGGFVASSEPVRRLLISSRLTSIMKKSSDMMLAKSNYRLAADQGTAVRKAVMADHAIVEVDRNGDSNPEVTTRSEQARESRVYSERLFGVLNKMDKNACISRLLCEIGADPSKHGKLGYKIYHYIRSVPPVTWNSATYPFIESFQAGLNNGKGECHKHYLTCTYDLNRVTDYFWHFITPIHS